MVAGGFGVLWGLGLGFLGVVFSKLFQSVPQTYPPSPTPAQVTDIFLLIYGAMGAVFAILGGLALAGGIFGVRRKAWGFALAGAIAAAMAFFPAGIVAVIFTSMARPEFQAPSPSA